MPHQQYEAGTDGMPEELPVLSTEDGVKETLPRPLPCMEGSGMNGDGNSLIMNEDTKLWSCTPCSRRLRLWHCHCIRDEIYEGEIDMMKNRTIYWIIGAWLLFLAVMALTGCRTKSVVEVVQAHDTLRVLSHDTVTKTVTVFQASSDSADRYQFRDRMEKILTTRDRTVTLNDRGDTTRVDTNTATLHYLHESDSTGLYREHVDSLTILVDTYKSKCDSLQSVIDRQHEKETVIKKKSLLKPILVTAFLVLMLALCFIVYKKK